MPKRTSLRSHARRPNRVSNACHVCSSVYSNQYPAGCSPLPRATAANCGLIIRVKPIREADSSRNPWMRGHERCGQLFLERSLSVHFIAIVNARRPIGHGKSSGRPHDAFLAAPDDIAKTLLNHNRRIDAADRWWRSPGLQCGEHLVLGRSRISRRTGNGSAFRNEYWVRAVRHRHRFEILRFSSTVIGCRIMR